MRLVSFIRTNVGFGGHDGPYQSSLGEAAEQLGWSFRCAVGTGWPKEQLSRFMTPALFQLSGRTGGPAGILNRLIYMRSLESALRAEIALPGEVALFADWPYVVETLALHLLLGALVEHKAQLWFMLRRMPKKGGLFERNYLIFFARARRALGPQFKLVTDSFSLAEHAAERWRLPDWTVLPIPHTEDALPTDARTNANDRVVMWWAGSPRPEKGHEIVLQMLSRDAGAADAEIVLPEMTFADRAQDLRVQLVPRGMSRPDYLSMLAASDMILLPYDPWHYQDGTSGVFVEAMTAGRLPVVMAGTWMAHELERLNLSELVLTQVAWTAPDIVERLVRLARDEPLKARFNDQRKLFVAAHGKAAFVEALRKLALPQAQSAAERAMLVNHRIESAQGA
ncbi:MAG: hypothetical protein WAW96_04445 [Alphaproteobacteria bacterium]